jgi:hypothetical protein
MRFLKYARNGGVMQMELTAQAKTPEGICVPILSIPHNFRNLFFEISPLLLQRPPPFTVIYYFAYYLTKDALC